MDRPTAPNTPPTRATSGRATPAQEGSTERQARERVIEHVEAFNQAVTSGDWAAFATRFAADARMSFVGVPAGPYVGRPAIATAYAENPPTDTMVLLGDPADGQVRFRWSAGGTGTMRLRWTAAGEVAELTVTFD